MKRVVLFIPYSNVAVTFLAALYKAITLHMSQVFGRTILDARFWMLVLEGISFYFLIQHRASSNQQCEAPQKKPLTLSVWGGVSLACIVTMGLLFLIKVAPVYALSYSDMQMNAPNPVGSGARALGLGGAFIAVADDATAASWNPAGMIQLKRPEVSFVGSFFSYNTDYNDVAVEAGKDERHLNYLSAVMPFELFRTNMVCSLNYQKLYEFSREYELNIGEAAVGGSKMRISKEQNGTLNTVSPALAIQIRPSLYFGMTANFWLEKGLDDYWENISIIEEEGSDEEGSVMSFGKYYEYYGFSGVNYHIGLMWKMAPSIHLGAVIKTPFIAKINHEYQLLSWEEHPEDPASNTYEYESEKKRFTLDMPLSYGVGLRLQAHDTYLIAFDIYRTHWEDYILHYPSGEELSPINNKQKGEAGIGPVTHIHVGWEYFFLRDIAVIPIRAGFFYDPEPAEGGKDHFYGIGVGMGIARKKYACDIAYQYRYGKKYEMELESLSVIRQHYLYLSTIYYF